MVVERFFLIGLDGDDVVITSDPHETFPSKLEILELLKYVDGVTSVKIDKRYMMEEVEEVEEDPKHTEMKNLMKRRGIQ